MSSGKAKCVGSFIGTGASKEIALDFIPRYVEIVNMSDLEMAKMSEGMGALSGKDGGISIDVAGAISGLAAAAGIILGERKFTVGTDNSVNGSGDHMAFIAHE